MLKALALINRVVNILFILLISSCHNNQFEAEYAGKDYCKCMEKYGHREWASFKYAHAICDGEMIRRNRYFKIFKIDMSMRDLDSLLSEKTRDSTRVFNLKFLEYTNTHCCEATFNCQLK